MQLEWENQSGKYSTDIIRGGLSDTLISFFLFYNTFVGLFKFRSSNKKREQSNAFNLHNLCQETLKRHAKCGSNVQVQRMSHRWEIPSRCIPSQHIILGHHRSTSETPFKWRFAGGPMVAHIYMPAGQVQQLGIPI